MEDSVIANNPILIVGFIAALLLGGYGLIKRRVSASRAYPFFSFFPPPPTRC